MLNNKNKWLDIPSAHDGDKREPAIDALYERGLLWLAEAQKRYGGSPPPGVARQPNVIPPLRPERRDLPGGDSACIPLGGLFAPGTVHEITVASAIKRAPSSVVSVIGAEILKECSRATEGKRPAPKLALWIGRATWPTPQFIDSILEERSLGSPSTAQELRAQCLFLDPPNEKLLLWSVDTALRSRAVGVVVAALPPLSLGLSRRLLLAAKEGGAIGVFPRTVSKSGAPLITASAVTSRCLITPEISTSDRPRWRIELLKYKGSPPRRTTWCVELCANDDDKNVPLHLSTDVVDRRTPSTTPGDDERTRERA